MENELEQAEASSRIIVAQHLAVLLSKKILGTHINEYGQKVDAQWQGELEHFVRSVLAPGLFPDDSSGWVGYPRSFAQLAGAKLDRMRAHVPDQLSEFLLLRGASGDSVVSYFMDYVDGIIEEELAKQAEMPTETPDPENAATGREFEQACAAVLLDHGWQVLIQGRAGDQGVDLIAEQAGFRIAIQCKLSSSPLGNTPVQEVHAGRAFHQVNAAAVVSNAPYTKGAQAAAARTGVLLLHHKALASLAGECLPD